VLFQRHGAGWRPADEAAPEIVHFRVLCGSAPEATMVRFWSALAEKELRAPLPVDDDPLWAWTSALAWGVQDVYAWSGRKARPPPWDEMHHLVASGNADWFKVVMEAGATAHLAARDPEELATCTANAPLPIVAAADRHWNLFGPATPWSVFEAALKNPDKRVARYLAARGMCGQMVPPPV
jgi:hypothetical protein